LYPERNKTAGLNSIGRYAANFAIEG
jgi:hypothetical protein